MQKKTSRYLDDKNIAVTRTFMEQECGGSDRLEAAVARGEIKCFRGADGLDYYTRKQLESGQRTSVDHVQATGGTTEITPAQHRAMADTLRTLRWDFPALTAPQEAKLQEQGEIPRKVKEKMAEAQSTLELLIRDAKKLMQEVTLQSGAGLKHRKELGLLAAEAATVASDLARTMLTGEQPDGSSLTTQVLTKALVAAAGTAESLYEKVTLTRSFISTFRK